MTFWLLLACVIDIKRQIIPKWITVPLFLSGLFYHAQYGGLQGVLNAIFGSLMFTFLIHFVESIDTIVNPTAKTVLGGGDYKLSLGAGAWVGAGQFTVLASFYLLFYAVVRSGIYLKSKCGLEKGMIKNIILDLKEELYGPGKPCRIAYAPYIAGPFLLTIYFLSFWR